MKTAELTGEMLDYWVALAEGWTRTGKEWHTKPGHRESKDYPGTILNDWDAKGPHDFLVSPDGEERIAYCGCESDGLIPRFSEDWSLGGPIIEREKMHGGPAGTLDGVTTWFYQCYRKDANGEHIPYPCGGSGQTPLIAAMRAYVASKFGEEVPETI